ncbi:MAG: M6 family metalloprotease domain-containing protein [Bacteroidales bacterium]|jgi:M6 family metalloprotease-like protein|nr:M6 family metalloprotease domain-containing protein [Bacteroidales bacterium]
MKNTKPTLFFVFLFFLFSALYAIPAIPYPVTFTQPDGKELTVMLRGDERIHWHESLDGYTLLYNKVAFLTYAYLDDEGNLQPSEFIATDIENRDIVVNSFLNTIDRNLFYSDLQKDVMKKVWEIEDDYETRSNRALEGQYKTLCAFVQFPEKAMIKTISQFEGLMNQLGYTGNGTGSVRDFFKESSYNKFDLIITLCGIYTAPQSESYYAGNDGVQNCQVLARWTALQVAAEPDINFADYDSNNDGKVDGFHFIFAGKGQEAGGGAGTIWSHKWQFSPAVIKNGKSISIYSCSPELYSNIITTIGVIVHEMTHAFGAPDFYDTNYGTGGQYDGTGNWDVMASGSWNGYPGGNRPVHHNMYTKIQFGWVTSTLLNFPITIFDMPNSAENPVAYRINTGNGNEHYLLENRQKIKFDTDLPGSGLLIYHVHTNVGTSGINDTHPQRMYPVCASSAVAIPVAGTSNYGNINSAGCTFPGTSGKTAFNGTSTPRMFHWTNTVISDKPITDITQNTSAKTISFNFMGGGIITPVIDITGVPTSALVGLPLTLTGTVIPNDATFKTILWSVINAGTTGATISGNTLNNTGTGTVSIKATIENGAAFGTSFTKNFDILVTKSSQTPPSAPTLLHTTPTSITLNNIPGCEYRRDSGDWQTSTAFEGLTINTTYNFQARKYETPTHFASDPSPESQFTTALIPVTHITDIPSIAYVKVPFTLNGTILPSNASYQAIIWSIYEDYNTNTTITDDVFFANATGFVTIEATIIDGIELGINYSQQFEVTVIKSTPIPPPAPILFSKTKTSITLNEVTGCEFRMDDGNWQISNFFEGLEINTTYSFQTKKIETETHIASEPSAKAFFTTDSIKKFSITASVNNALFGTITPNGIITVDEEETLSFNIAPLDKYKISNVLVNNENKGELTTYTFENIQSNGTIHVIFTEKVGIRNNELSNINVFSHQNRIFIKNESNVPIKSVEIIDMMGRLIYQNEINSIETVIPLYVETGVYHVILYNKDLTPYSIFKLLITK